MAAVEDVHYPPHLDAAEKARLVEVVKDWTIAHGLAVRPGQSLVEPKVDPNGVLATSAPVALFPSLFPRECFEDARSVQKPYNELYARVSQDEEYLAGVVKEVGDEFVDNLWAVHLKVKGQGYTQPLSLGLFRSDYILHEDKSEDSAGPQLKQVEFNTIASSFGGLSVQTSALHKYIHPPQHTPEYLASPRSLPVNGVTSFDLPDNHSATGLASGMRAAFDAYGPSELGHERCILFLVQGGEKNVFDQRHLEYALQGPPSAIPVFRLPFSETLQRTKTAPTAKRQLLYSLPSNPGKTFEVALVYLRAGYGPSDYTDPSAWDARYQLEASAAIKCPTVLTQIAGTKKVQQLLAAPQTASSPPGLARFLRQDSPDFARVQRTFTNIYPMDGTSAAGQLARRLATDAETSQRFVLKPQREGGGNNTYRGAIPARLRALPEAQWGAFILMELITPPQLANTILRHGQLEQGGVICELGVYGACLWDGAAGRVLVNEECGYLLRTKGDQSEEGGVAAGYGCMDSCNLV